MLTTMTMTNSIPSLPPEIWTTIFQNALIERRDLLAVCSVSHTFRAEAERLLYASVDLNHPSKLMPFCLAVIRWPYLVQSMHTLTMKLPSPGDLEEASLDQMIAWMLHLSINLQHMHVLGKWGNYFDEWDASNQTIIDGHAFKLKTFKNVYFPPYRLERFLESQPTLETHILPFWNNVTPLHLTSFPNLKNLSCNIEILMDLSAPSGGYTGSVERLQLTTDGVEKEDEPLFFAQLKSQLCSTLKSLDITRYQCGMEGLELAEFVSLIASQFPNIKFLSIKHSSVNHKTETLERPFPTPLPTGFTQLETLILDAPRTTWEPCCSCYQELRTDEGRLKVTTRIIAALPTLKRLVLVDSDVCEYKRRHGPRYRGMLWKVHLADDEWLTVV